MTRDYKKSRTAKRQDSSSRPWVWLVAGFGLGLVAALVMYLNIRQPSQPVATSPVPNITTTPQSTLDTEELTTATSRSTASAGVDELPPQKLPAQGQPNFDFYNVLPEFEVVVPESDEPSAPNSGRTAQPKAITVPGTYILQAGSFRKFTDADRRKAELALKGVESNIQQVVLDNDQTWYRVYVGPTQNLNTLENTRSLLRRESIDVLLLKVRQ